ncbi:MAG: Ca2+-dependent phosphoinositide-specific phospholipase C [Actinomycetota bacterium]
MRRSSPLGSPGAALLLALIVVASACGGSGGEGESRRPVPLAPGLRLDQVQVLGTHNSYHLRAFPEVWRTLQESVPAIAAEIDYEHPPLPEQFDLGVRQIELDLADDPAGTKYAPPPGETYPNLPDDPVMREPGFKVLHQAGVDTNSSCLTLAACLGLVRDWSEAHPGHVPIAIYLDLKDADFGPERLDRLEAEIRTAIPARQLLTPDAVRGDFPTLGAAVRERGWPVVDRIRGRIWIYAASSEFRRTALARHPGLRGSAVFTTSEPGAADAAVKNAEEPGADRATIADALRANMIVRTRADADTYEARAGNTARRDAALASGAHLVATDYELPDARFGTGYVVRIPGGTPGRCNPVTAPPGCRPQDVEDPATLTRPRG